MKTLVPYYHNGECHNLSIVDEVSLTCSIHTAGSERVFSVQNRILTNCKNRLGKKKQLKKPDSYKTVRKNRSIFKFEDVFEEMEKGEESINYKYMELFVKL